MMASEGDQLLESYMGQWKNATDFLFKLLMGIINLVNDKIKLLKNDREVKAPYQMQNLKVGSQGWKGRLLSWKWIG